MEIKRHGISTPLLAAYGREILKRTGAETLSAARHGLVRPTETDRTQETGHV